MTAPMNGADLLKRIRPTLPELSTEICLRPDLIRAFHEAEEELVRRQAADSGGRMTDGISKATREQAEVVAALEKDLVEHSITFLFRALPKDKWQALLDEHAPRGDNQLDLYAGYNRDAVLDAAVRKCLIDPLFDDESWTELVGVLPEGEWRELRDTVNTVNSGVVDPPKSELASRILNRGGSTSR